MNKIDNFIITVLILILVAVFFHIRHLANDCRDKGETLMQLKCLNIKEIK